MADPPPSRGTGSTTFPTRASATPSAPAGPGASIRPSCRFSSKTILFFHIDMRKENGPAPDSRVPGHIRPHPVAPIQEDSDGRPSRNPFLVIDRAAGARAADKRSPHRRREILALLENQREGKLPKKPVKMLNQIPLVLQMIIQRGIKGFTDPITKIPTTQGIWIHQHAFTRSMTRPKNGNAPHFMTQQSFEDLAEALTRPIAILDESRADHYAKGKLLFMVDVKDGMGGTVIAAVELERTEKGLVLNMVDTAFGKIKGKGNKNKKKYVQDNNWFVNQINTNARYIDMNQYGNWIAREFQAGSRPLIPQRNASGIMNLSNSHGHKVFADADLVKLLRRKIADGEPGAHLLHSKDSTQHIENTHIFDRLAQDLVAEGEA